MGLLSKWRRGWIVVFVGLLWLPMLGQAFMPAASQSQSEGRALRAFPELPRSRAGWRDFPKWLEGFLSDHFGFRGHLTHANALLRYTLASPSNRQVLYGRDGFLFFRGEQTIEQTMGVLLRRDALERLADLLAGWHAELSRRNIKFLVASPPNNSTINRVHLPAWAAARPVVTEYDLMLKLLAARHVPAIDLRPALQADHEWRPNYYRTDTHWNLLGAVIGRNEMVQAIGHPEWALDITRVFRGHRRTYGKDLARFIGLPSMPEDQEADIDVSSYPEKDGPTVLIVGDSFTHLYFPQIWRNGGRLARLGNLGCRLSLEDILRHEPAVVIFAPTERYLGSLC